MSKTQFIKAQKGGSLLNKAINNLPFEMHLLGHNFTGPGTKLKKWLNPDFTPKEWSKPVNRVDEAAKNHDICYMKYSDTKTRNDVCDKNMLKELKGIYNPTIRERMERGLVASLMVDMQSFSKFNRGVKYFLAVTDVFSKYGYLIPLKDKTGKSVASALKTIFKEMKPEKCGWIRVKSSITRMSKT